MLGVFARERRGRLWLLLRILGGALMAAFMLAYSQPMPAIAAERTDVNLRVTYTASATEVPAGSSVTYTYTLTNLYPYTQWNDFSTTYRFQAAADSGCNLTSAPVAVRAGTTETFTCTVDNVTSPRTSRFTYTYYTYDVNRDPTASWSKKIVSYRLNLRVGVVGYPAVPQEFGCTASTVLIGANASQFDGNPSAGTKLYSQYGNEGSDVFLPMGAGGSSDNWQYNAMAWRPADDKIYAITSGTDATKAGNLVTVDSDGQVTVVRELKYFTGLVADRVRFEDDLKNGMTSGAFIGDDYYFSNASGVGSKFLYRMKVTDTRAAAHIRTSSFNANDFTEAYEYLWGLSNTSASGTSNPEMLRFNPRSNSVDRYSLGATLPKGTYGAAWTFGNGNLGFSANDGSGIYQISVTNPGSTPTFALVAKTPGPGATNNDGTYCLSTQTPDLAVSVAANYPRPHVGSRVTWRITVTNVGPGVSTGGVLSDEVPSGYTSPRIEITDGYTSATDPIAQRCSISKDTVTCALTVLSPGETMTIPVSAIVPDTPNIDGFNRASVLANEKDPNSANNTATATTRPTRAAISIRKRALEPVSSISASGVESAQFAIAIRNSGSEPGQYGPILDVPVLADGLTLTSFTWSGGPNNVAATTASGTGSPATYRIGAPNTAIAANSEHEYRVTFEFTRRSTLTDAASLACEGVAGTGPAVTNSVTLAAANLPTTDTAACVHATPALQVRTTVRRDDDPPPGSSTLTVPRGASVRYRYAVSLPSGYPEPMRDIRVSDDHITSLGPVQSGDTNANRLLDRGETWIYEASATRLADVRNTATGTGTGVNTGAAARSTDQGQVFVQAVDASKAAGTVTGPVAGLYTVSYTAKVVNTGTVASSYGPLIDTSAFDAQLVPVDASWTGASSGTATLKNTPQFTLTRGANLPPGGEHLWAITVRYRVNGDADLTACAGPGTGLHNTISLPNQSETRTDNNSACATPTTTISVAALSNRCAEGQSTCPVLGAAFALYDTDPAALASTPIMPTLAPINGAGQEGRFASDALQYGKDYWIVQTRAPTGHNLLAAAARVRLSAGGLTIIDAASHAATIRVDPTNPLRLQVTDSVPVSLPAAGGKGPSPMLGAALLLLLAALGYHHRYGRPESRP